MAKTTRRPLSRSTLTTGPWVGVWDSPDPYDGAANRLTDLKNCYIPDAADGSGAQARPGFVLQNGGAALGAAEGQGIYRHTMLDGSSLNFCVVNGHLFRVNAGFTVFTDVTPGGVSIGNNHPVYFASMPTGELIVNDGNFRPWIGTNLTSTPITGTYIDYDGAGVAWTAFGQPKVKDGALIFILNVVGGVSRRMDISWSVAGDPAHGYQQATFDYNWTLVTSDTGPLYALEVTEAGLLYFRENSFSIAYGTVNADFRSTANRDLVSFNVGTRTCRSVQKFGDAIFFCDAIGRPYRWTPGNPPTPIWHQLRGKVNAARTDAISVTDQMVASVIEPTLGLYLVAIWSPNPNTNARPTRLYAFDAATGNYVGWWTVYDYSAAFPGLSQGIHIEALGIMANVYDVGSVCLLGGLTGLDTATGGFLWILAQEADARRTPGSLFDHQIMPDRVAQTDRLGYSEDVVYTVDNVTAITGDLTPCSVSVRASATANKVQGTPAPSGSPQDETSRLVVGCDGVQGRGPSVTVSPTDCIGLWTLHRIAITAVPSTASPDEP